MQLIVGVPWASVGQDTDGVGEPEGDEPGPATQALDARSHRVLLSGQEAQSASALQAAIMQTEGGGWPCLP